MSSLSAGYWRRVGRCSFHQPSIGARCVQHWWGTIDGVKQAFATPLIGALVYSIEACYRENAVQ